MVCLKGCVAKELSRTGTLTCLRYASVYVQTASLKHATVLGIYLAILVGQPDSDSCSELYQFGKLTKVLYVTLLQHFTKYITHLE